MIPIHIHQLTYNQTLHHCILNYSLILANLYTHIQSNVSIKFKSILTIIGIQLYVLSLSPHTKGVSLIWCGFLGLTLGGKLNQTRKDLIVIRIINLMVLSYYVVAYHPISSVAHFLAVVIARLMGRIESTCYGFNPFHGFNA